MSVVTTSTEVHEQHVLKNEHEQVTESPGIRHVPSVGLMSKPSDDNKLRKPTLLKQRQRSDGLESLSVSNSSLGYIQEEYGSTRWLQTNGSQSSLGSKEGGPTKIPQRPLPNRQSMGLLSKSHATKASPTLQHVSRVGLMSQEQSGASRESDNVVEKQRSRNAPLRQVQSVGLMSQLPTPSTERNDHGIPEIGNTQDEDIGFDFEDEVGPSLGRIREELEDGSIRSLTQQLANKFQSSLDEEGSASSNKITHRGVPNRQSMGLLSRTPTPTKATFSSSVPPPLRQAPSVGSMSPEQPAGLRKENTMKKQHLGSAPLRQIQSVGLMSQLPTPSMARNDNSIPRKVAGKSKEEEEIGFNLGENEQAQENKQTESKNAKQTKDSQERQEDNENERSSGKEGQELSIPTFWNVFFSTPSKDWGQCFREWEHSGTALITLVGAAAVVTLMTTTHRNPP